MDRELLIEAMTNLDKLDQISLRELNQWIDMYPFAQSLHLLKAKKLQGNGKTIDLEPFHRLACYTTDHANLYDLMTEDSLITSFSGYRKVELNERLTQLINDAKAPIKNIVSAEEQMTESPVILSNDPIVEQKIKRTTSDQEEDNDEEFESSPIDTQQVDRIESDKSETSDKRRSDIITIEDVYEDEPRLLDVSPSTKKKKKKKKKKKAKAKKKSKKDKLKKKKQASAQKEYNTESSKIESTDINDILPADIAGEIDPFTIWLQSLKPTSEEAPKQTSMAKDKKKKKDKKKAKKSSKKKDSKKLDKIAKKLKKKEKKKKKKAKKIDKLQRKIDASLERKSEIVSPTLAAFMKKQGHYKEAIKIYKQLKLIYPEKSSYFASEIKKLKKLC